LSWFPVEIISADFVLFCALEERPSELGKHDKAGYTETVFDLGLIALLVDIAKFPTSNTIYADPSS
jgi:hypothetical protein